MPPSPKAIVVDQAYLKRRCPARRKAEPWAKCGHAMARHILGAGIECGKCNQICVDAERLIMRPTNAAT